MNVDERLAVDLCADQLRRRVPGGTGTYVRGLLTGLRTLEGVQVSATVSRPRRGQPRDLSLLVPTHSWPLPQPFSQPFVDAGLFRGSKTARVVHTGSLGGPSPRRGQVATVAIHDLLWRSESATLSRRGAAWHKAAYARARRECCGVVTGAPSVRDELLADGWSEEQILVAPHGADHLAPPDRDAAMALLKRHGVTGPFLVTASTLEPRKNLRRVVAARRQVVAAGLDLPLVVVGPSGWGSDGLEGADHNVIAVGHVAPEILSALLSSAEMVLSLSLAEGYGLPVLEAMSLGAVVVASNTTPAAHELRCVMVDPLDTEAMAVAIGELLGNDEMRTQCQVAAKAATSNRPWAKSAALHEAFWRRHV